MPSLFCTAAKPAAVLIGATEFAALREHRRFLTAIGDGLADVNAGRVLTTQELKKSFEAEFAVVAHSPPVSRHVARASRGFDIHAGVSVPEQDREGRERLLRYCARPPLSLERLSVLADGRVAYRIKNPRGKQTHRVTSPIQFLARLCALIPPPRHPLVRFHGVFAPHSAWRPHVVALVHGNSPACEKGEAPACREESAGDPDSNSGAPL